MRQLNKQEIQSLDLFNNKLKSVEKNIYSLALKQNQIAKKKMLEKENDIFDYELRVSFYVYGDDYRLNKDDDEYLLANWSTNIKILMMKDKWWGINDNNCHNTTSSFQKNIDLNSQKHCWLLHSLYDDYMLSWDDIWKIDTICFDIKIKYEYTIKITI